MSIIWADLTPIERNVLVAEKVMGYKYHPEVNFCVDDWGECVDLDDYTTRIYDAWQVVEEMQNKFDTVCMVFSDQLWHCIISEFISCECECIDPEDCECLSLKDYQYDSPSAPEAICLAALKACGVEVVT